MADDTQTHGGPTTPSAIGYCSWHEGSARDIRLIMVVGPGTGPEVGHKRFACHPCQITYGLVPLADRA